MWALAPCCAPHLPHGRGKGLQTRPLLVQIACTVRSGSLWRVLKEKGTGIGIIHVATVS